MFSVLQNVDIIDHAFSFQNTDLNARANFYSFIVS